VKRGVRLGTLGTTIACAVVGVALFAAGSAYGVAQTIVANDNFFGPVAGGTPTYTMDQGDRPALQNAGGSQHNATATGNGPDGKPLFSSPTIGTGTTTLDGTQYLTAGSYTFICTIHPSTMIATLAVSGNGVPTPRPTLGLKVIGKSIGTAIKRGLRVRMQLGTKADGLELEARLGKTIIAKQGGISQAQGTSFQQLKLNKAGKSRLRKREKATVTVTGLVPFGSPASTKARLKQK
jgi:plastocyanin